MKKIITLVVLTILTLSSTMLLPAVQAIPLMTDKGSYVEYVGTLGGANYVVRIPDTWNGMLIVGCHGYTYPTWTPDCQLAMDGVSSAVVNLGFAYAASSYGEGGYAVKEGMLHTHQLTEWVIDNFHVNGKVILVGASMGGTISLLLGEKYPELYDGVLDVCGGKDLTARYNYIQSVLANPNLPAASRAYMIQWGGDIVAACGGTPSERQQFYDRLSPTCYADISIPVISVHGSLDTLLPLTQAQAYGVAVAQAGCSQFYKAYTVTPTGPGTAGHCTSDVMAAAFSRLNQLVSYPNGW